MFVCMSVCASDCFCGGEKERLAEEGRDKVIYRDL